MSQILTLLGSSITLFSSIVWILLIAYSIVDSNTSTEKQVKHIALWLLISHFAVWALLISYHYHPQIALVFNIPGYLGMLIVPVQLYRLVCKLSEGEKLKPFSLWHYLLPILIVGGLAVWSMSVPLDVQLWLLENKGALHADFIAYSQLFLSKHPLKFIFTVVYLPLTLIRLLRYYIELNREAKQKRRPALWVTLFMGCVVLVLLGTLTVYIYPRNELVVKWPTIAFAFCLMIEQSIIGYHLISRDFLLYIKHEEEPKVTKNIRVKRKVKNLLKIHKENYPALTNELVATTDNKLKLTQKNFDIYMKDHKPWLDPQLLMTDLLEPFQATRNSLSAFVNRTYGINFNRYINRLRLAEVEKLSAKPINADKTRNVLALEAGFANDRSYRRAVEAERMLLAEVTEQADEKGGIDG